MSLLLHLCRTCRHRATSHEGGDKGYSRCPCCRGPGDVDPLPVLVESFTEPGGVREPLHPPGTEWNPGTLHRLTLCDCDPCRVRHAELTSAVPDAS